MSSFFFNDSMDSSWQWTPHIVWNLLTHDSIVFHVASGDVKLCLILGDASFEGCIWRPDASQLRDWAVPFPQMQPRTWPYFPVPWRIPWLASSIPRRIKLLFSIFQGTEPYLLCTAYLENLTLEFFGCWESPSSLRITIWLPKRSFTIWILSDYFQVWG